MNEKVSFFNDMIRIISDNKSIQFLDCFSGSDLVVEVIHNNRISKYEIEKLEHIIKNEFNDVLESFGFPDGDSDWFSYTEEESIVRQIFSDEGWIDYGCWGNEFIFNPTKEELKDFIMIYSPKQQEIFTIENECQI